MRVASIIAVAALSLAACAPSLEANGEGGVTIQQSQLRIGSARDDAEVAAVKYCSQFGRIAHLASEQVSWFWSATFRYECV